MVPNPIKSARSSRAWFVFVLAAGLGFLLWWLSPVFTGQVEPWDARIPYYWIGLFLTGGLAACASPRHFWAAAPGIFTGQLAYMILRVPSGPLALLGILFMAILCVVPLAGAAVIFAVYQSVREN